MTKTSYDFRTPPADSFSPYEYLYRFFKGCVALAVVDESHNGRGRDTDIARSHHFAMLAAQTRQLTSEPTMAATCSVSTTTGIDIIQLSGVGLALAGKTPRRRFITMEWYNNG